MVKHGLLIQMPDIQSNIVSLLLLQCLGILFVVIAAVSHEASYCYGNWQ